MLEEDPARQAKAWKRKPHTDLHKRLACKAYSDGYAFRHRIFWLVKRMRQLLALNTQNCAQVTRGRTFGTAT